MSTAEAASELDGPRNIAVISGSNASFSCVIHAQQSDVCWSHQNILTGNIDYLYLQGTTICDDGKCNVTFDKETNYYELTINSVQHYDAGFYECGRCQGADQRAAQLVVLSPFDGTEGMKTRRVR